MTVEEAKNKLEEMRVEFDYTLHDEAVNAIDVALEALEMQISKKPITKEPAYFLCPTCKRSVQINVDFCDKCGQKIDWQIN